MLAFGERDTGIAVPRRSVRQDPVDELTELGEAVVLLGEVAAHRIGGMQEGADDVEVGGEVQGVRETTTDGGALAEREGEFGVGQRGLGQPELGAETSTLLEQGSEERALGPIPAGDPLLAYLHQQRLAGVGKSVGRHPGDLRGLPQPPETQGRTVLEQRGERDLVVRQSGRVGADAACRICCQPVCSAPVS